jgi:8-oxo-dGTP pyrophosphatase MutT (NUDIX family)
MPETRHDLRAAVAARRPVDARERQSVDDFLRLFDTLVDPFSETASPVHVTGSAILVSEDRTRVLLHQHKRLGLWLQPGGHIEPGELPWDGSLREASEETGLPVAFAGGEPQLVHLDVHPGPRKHTHLDLRYLVTSPLVPPTPPEGESQQVQWFQWHQAIAMAEPGLEGVLRSLQPGTPKIRTVRGADAGECAHVYLRSRAFGLPDVPVVHANPLAARAPAPPFPAPAPAPAPGGVLVTNPFAAALGGGGDDPFAVAGAVAGAVADDPFAVAGMCVNILALNLLALLA